MGTKTQLIFVLLGLHVSSIFCQDCSIAEGNFIHIGTDADGGGSGPYFNWPEDVTADTVLRTLSTSQLMALDGEGAEVEYKNILRYEFEENAIIIKPGPDFGNYLDERKTDVFVVFGVNFTCPGNPGNSPKPTMLIYWEPTNNKEPSFNMDSLSINGVILPWNTEIPLNYKDPLIVTDEDFLVGGLQEVVSENPDFEAVWNRDTGDVKVMSKNKIFESTPFNIIARDGNPLHDKVLPVTITVTGNLNISPPKFSKVYYPINTNPGIGGLITSFDVTDPDNDPGVEFVFSSPDPNVVFDQEEKTVSFISGFAPTPNELPYALEVTATESKDSDPGFEPLSTTVLVLLNYEEDQIFNNKIYQISVPESTSAGDQVGAVSVNIPQGYTISFEDGETNFEIRSGNVVHALKDFTPEIIESFQNGVYSASLIAKDQNDALSKQHAIAVFYFVLPPTATTTSEPCPTVTTTTEMEPGSTTTSGPCDCTTTTQQECPTPTPEMCASTTPQAECPSTTTECDCSSSSTTTLSTCEPCICTTTEFTTPTGPCEPCDSTPTTTTSTECPITCEPCSSTPTTVSTDCPPISTTTSEPCQCDCTSTPITTTECATSTTTIEPEPCPTTCPPPSELCPTPTTVEPEPCPTTCPPPSEPCPTPTTIQPEPCPTPTTVEPEPCPTTCPPPTEPCPTPTTIAPEPCPTTCPPPVTEPCPTPTTIAPEPCPTTCPPPVTSEPCPTTCPPPVTNEPCPITCPPPVTREPCPTPLPQTGDENCDNNETALIAVVAVMSVLFVASAGIAGYLYYTMRKSSGGVNNKTFDDFGEINETSGRRFSNPRMSFARTGSIAAPSDKIPFASLYDDIGDKPATSSAPVVTGFENPVFRRGSVVSGSNPSARRSSVLSSSSKVGEGEKKELKPSLAKPKEIPADYDGAEVVQEKIPKKDRKILFVGEEVIPNVDEEITEDQETERL